VNIIRADFTSNNCRCAADLYSPQVDNKEPDSKPPIIVMAHGFAGERKARLPAFAERFCAAGFAVLLFDYRGFGDSEGKPKQLVSPWRQLDDWRAAIAHARMLSSVDASRIILWGSSFSGGHVVSLASEDQHINAIISQIPFTSGLSLALSNSLPDMLHMTWAGLKDVARALVSAEPYGYPVVGRPGQHAFMNTEESYDGYLQLFPKDTQWVNEVPARINLQVPCYNPIYKAKNVGCPALVIAGVNDSLIPAIQIKKMAEAMVKSEYVEMPTDHFQPYVGDEFENNIAIQLAFLAKL